MGRTLIRDTMAAMELSRLSVLDLLNRHAEAVDELRQLGIVRSANNPVGDYAEHLFCKAFGWQQADQSEKDADAIGADDTRYQIKSRRLTPQNMSRQLGALRRLRERNFDLLAGVLFNEDFSILRAGLIPHALVKKNSRYVKATNSWRFILRDEVWTWEGVKDVTDTLADAQK